MYITEAHPIDAWQVTDNLEDAVLVATTPTADERHTVAGLCVKDLGIEFSDFRGKRLDQNVSGKRSKVWAFVARLIPGRASVVRRG